ncbi:MAG TPA: 23S rRNA (pseudouridine(1915)-N(3))-methyltransferase RlmH [Gemmatimonadaceae bacterium]|nr:23S rRNA (pseudouridine(1915)-N(3))-methyltransferase RlmH [Gemmatimonadaceae bacterium]
MRFCLSCVGRPRDAAIATAIAEYETRAARYWPLDIREVKSATSAKDADSARDTESERLLAAAGEAVLIVCDERGKSFTSREFADWMQKQREAARDVAFVIGGAFGVNDDLRQRAKQLLALAPWTLPHELSRLVLAEQLYRAGTILKGEPYHK